MIYKPIIGEKAYNLYLQFYNFLNTKKNKFQECLLFTKDHTFGEIIDSLERLILLKLITVYKKFNDSETLEYHIVLNRVYEFCEFIQDKRWEKWLVNAIGNDRFEELKFSNTIKIPQNVELLPIDDRKVMKRMELENSDLVDIDTIISQVCKKTKTIITLDEECRKMINSFYMKQHFSIDEATNCLIKSIVPNSNSINPSLLTLEFNNLLSLKDEKDFDIQNISLNRNKKIFTCNLNSDEKNFKEILLDYSQYTPEQYLLGLKKDKLDDEDIEFLNKLKRKTNAPRMIINYILDYSFVKTEGKTKGFYKYALKVGDTINSYNYSSFQEIHDHLNCTKWDANKQKRVIQTFIQPKPLFDLDELSSKKIIRNDDSDDK